MGVHMGYHKLGAEPPSAAPTNPLTAMKAWCVSSELSVVAVTGMLNLLPSSSIKSTLAVKDMGLWLVKVTWGSPGSREVQTFRLQASAFGAVSGHPGRGYHLALATHAFT